MFVDIRNLTTLKRHFLCTHKILMKNIRILKTVQALDLNSELLQAKTYYNWKSRVTHHTYWSI